MSEDDTLTDLPSVPGPPSVPVRAAVSRPAIGPATRHDPAPPLAAGNHEPAERPASRRRLTARGPWPLLAVLAVQAVLSARLVWSNTAFTDEAQYLWSGHAEWAHLLHGTPAPKFATYFSGSPVMYPPIGALADSIGGLAAARLLSLVFMLGVTALLWDLTRRLFGRRAAFFSAALFVTLGPTIKLGAFATYDPMALLLLAAAAWCMVRAGPRRDATGWAAAAGLLLLASNMTKYATALFVPAVLLLTYLAARVGCDRKVALMRAVTVGLCWVSGIIGCWEIATAGNGYYATGIESTTLNRAASTASVAAVIHSSWTWIGLVTVIALAGAVLAWGVSRRYALLLTVLAATALLVPAEQARIHTLTSLDKHADFGAWFAVVAAGYFADRLIGLIRPSAIRFAVAGAATAGLLYPLYLGAAQARSLFGWANAARMVTALRAEMPGVRGNVLIDVHSVAEYYLRPPESRFRYWSSSSSLILPSGRTIAAPVGDFGPPKAYEVFIRKGYFQLIALNTYDSLGGPLTVYLKNDPSYVRVAAVPYGPGRYITWKYEPRQGAR